MVFRSALAVCGVGLLVGCAVPQPATITVPARSMGRSIVMGGQNPVAGATIGLYAVGTVADGSNATSILTQSVTTASDGTFSLLGAYQCPAAASLVFVVATGGNPGLGAGVTNPSLAMMAVIGRCDSLSTTSSLEVNEVTTVAATSALAGWLSSWLSVGSGTADAAALASAMAVATELVNPATGAAPGLNVPAGATVPVAKINTLADAAADCVNTAGGVAGDGTACGKLFTLTTPPGGVAPTDTVTALANLADAPTMNTAALYALATPVAAYTPILTAAPPDFQIGLIYGQGLTVSSDVMTFLPTYVGFPSASMALSVSNAGTSAVGLTGTSVVGPTSAADFTETDNCPTTLASQATCTAWVVFTPSAAAARVGYLTFSNSTGTATQVELNGTGVANPPTTYPTSLNQGTVFMGASIVNYWPMPIHDVGIPGQVTSQMLSRFQTDVLGHGYARVVILGGSNDILDGVSGVPSELVNNIAAMAQMAASAGMEVVLSELPPSSQMPVTAVPFNTTVVQVNAGIRQLAIQHGYLVVDYYTPMIAHPEYFPDGLHPNATGYAVMEAQLAGVVSR